MSRTNKALQLIDQMGWEHKISGDHAILHYCPLCSNSNFKFFLNITDDKDGLWDCKVCGETGNLWKLKKQLGLSNGEVMSMREAAQNQQGIPPLPNFDYHHEMLFDAAYDHVLQYCLDNRRWSLDVIKRFKIGANTANSMDWVVIPYFGMDGEPTYCKMRSVPPAEKRFMGSKGRQAPLFNEGILKSNMEELILVEGEADALALISAGVENVVGVPGAAIKKATWIDRIDRVKPKIIFLLYDNDKAGQEGAKNIAAKIGIEKVLNILLPPFEVDGKPGKDITDWFNAGKTIEELLSLRAEAQPFAIDGVSPLCDVIVELRDAVENKGVEPTYDMMWPSLTKRAGGAELGDLVGIMAEGKIGKTTMGLNLMDYFARKGENTLMFCNEMLPMRMVHKWVSMVTNTPSNAVTVDSIDAALSDSMNIPGEMFFGYTRVLKADDVFETIRNAVRRYGIKHVCFDNLQLLVRSHDHFVQETSVLTKRFKELAMDLKIVMWLIIQPNRVAEGHIVSARNAYGSSAIEKDVDTMICLHRERVGTVKAAEFAQHGFIETDETFHPELLVSVDLSRYAAGGKTTLLIDGATSRITELAEKPAPPQVDSGILVAA